MLTPEDVENKVFKRSMRGYDIEDVEDFLQELGEDFETLYRENIRAEKRISMLTDALKQAQTAQQSLPNTVPLAKEAIRIAERQVEDTSDTSNQTKQQMDAELSRVRGELADITYQYEQMKRSVEVFRAKVVALLNAQLSIIKDYSEVAIDEETVNRAKALLEMTLPETEKKISVPEKEADDLLRDTREIPVVSDEDTARVIGSDSFRTKKQ